MVFLILLSISGRRRLQQGWTLDFERLSPGPAQILNELGSLVRYVEHLFLAK